MIGNTQFLFILKKYNKELSLTVNNNLSDMGQLRYKGNAFSGVPRNYFPLEDIYKNGSLAYRGLKTIAAALYKIRENDEKFEILLQDLGITGKDRHDVYVKATKDPDWNKVRVKNIALKV